MPEYQIIQLHDSVDSTTLQFPKVPLEALIEDPNQRLVPFGIPVRAVVLTSMASAFSPPEKANQRYYNTESHKLYTAIRSGAALVWDAGEYPQDGILYKVSQPGVMSDTLYVKSIGTEGVGLAKLAFDRTVTYSGPFAVGYTRYTDGTCNCSVASGKVFAPWSAYDVPLESGIVVSANEDLYIVGSSGASAILFQYTTNPVMQGDMRTRIARNAGGVMIQCQYGDILLAGITSSSGPTPPTPSGDLDYIPISTYPAGATPQGSLTYIQIEATDGQQHSGTLGYIEISSYVPSSGGQVLLSDLTALQINSTDGQQHSGALQYIPINTVS